LPYRFGRISPRGTTVAAISEATPTGCNCLIRKEKNKSRDFREAIDRTSVKDDVHN
jgi:hypothetical protein